MLRVSHRKTTLISGDVWKTPECRLKRLSLFWWVFLDSVEILLTFRVEQYFLRCTIKTIINLFSQVTTQFPSQPPSLFWFANRVATWETSLKSLFVIQWTECFIIQMFRRVFEESKTISRAVVRVFKRPSGVFKHLSYINFWRNPCFFLRRLITHVHTSTYAWKYERVRMTACSLQHLRCI